MRVSPLDPASMDETLVFSANREGPPSKPARKTPRKREAISITLGRIDPRRGY